jgi:hypothetical protein
MSMEKRATKIPKQVMRFNIPDSDYGDRGVPVVLAEHASDPDLRDYAILIDEFIAEQLDYRVVDDLLVLNSNGDLKYDSEYGLQIPDHYNNPYERLHDVIPVFSYRVYLLWTGELEPFDFLVSAMN